MISPSISLSIRNLCLVLMLSLTLMTASGFAQGSKDTATTIEQAARVIDLRTFPLMDGVEAPESRQVNMVSYTAKSTPPKAFQFYQTQLTKQGWKEIPGTSSTDAYASGSFEKSGFIVSIMSSMYDNSGTMITVTNMGNVPATGLPVVKGAESVFGDAMTAIYTTDKSVVDAAKDMRALLQKSGWAPYGEQTATDEQQIFVVKKNAIQLTVMVSSDQAQGKKTSILMNPVMMSADIPAPADAKDVQFSGSQKVLTFSSESDFETVGAFYVKILSVTGWKPTSDKVSVSEGDFGIPNGLIVFRNAAEDLLSVEMEKRDDLTKVAVRHLTKAEIKQKEEEARNAAELAMAERQREAEESVTAEPTPESVLADQLRSQAEDDVRMALEDANSQIADALKDLPGGASDLIPGAAKKTTENGGTKQGTKATKGAGNNKKSSGQGSSTVTGSITIGGRNIRISNVVAYEVDSLGDRMIRVYATEEPANLEELKAVLKENRDDGAFSEFQPQVRLDIMPDGSIVGYNFWADNASVGAYGGVNGTAKIRNGRITGTATLKEKGELSDREYNFELKFDADILPLPEVSE